MAKRKVTTSIGSVSIVGYNIICPMWRIAPLLLQNYPANASFCVVFFRRYRAKGKQNTQFDYFLSLSLNLISVFFFVKQIYDRETLSWRKSRFTCRWCPQHKCHAIKKMSCKYKWKETISQNIRHLFDCKIEQFVVWVLLLNGIISLHSTSHSESEQNLQTFFFKQKAKINIIIYNSIHFIFFGKLIFFSNLFVDFILFSCL